MTRSRTMLFFRVSSCWFRVTAPCREPQVEMPRRITAKVGRIDWPIGNRLNGQCDSARRRALVYRAKRKPQAVACIWGPIDVKGFLVAKSASFAHRPKCRRSGGYARGICGQCAACRTAREVALHFVDEASTRLGLASVRDARRVPRRDKPCPL